jgi:hypothetical protein
MSRKSKAKAVRHQNEIRDMIRTIFCPPFDVDDVVSRTMGNSGSDIILSPEIKKIIPFEIECKNHSDGTWSGTYKSSFEQTFNREQVPLLIRRKSRSGNHYFAYTDDVLEIHPGIFRSEKKITAHDNLRTFALTNKFNIQIYNEYIHFNDKKFIEILSCLKKYYSR